MQTEVNWFAKEPSPQKGSQTSYYATLNDQVAVNNEFFPGNEIQQGIINEIDQPAPNPLQVQINPPIPINQLKNLSFQPQLNENNRFMVEENADFLEGAIRQMQEDREVTVQIDRDESDQETRDQEGVQNNMVIRQRPLPDPNREINARCKTNEKTDVQLIHQKVLGQHPEKELQGVLTRFIKRQVNINDRVLSRKPQFTKGDLKPLLRGFSRDQLDRISDLDRFRTYIDTRYQRKKFKKFSKLAGEKKSVAILMHKICLIILFTRFRHQASKLWEGNIQNLRNYTDEMAHEAFETLGIQLARFYSIDFGALLEEINNPIRASHIHQ